MAKDAKYRRLDFEEAILEMIVILNGLHLKSLSKNISGKDARYKQPYQ
jgi:hypothetical protein